ncbi:hypothetical protein D8X55_00535 [Malacoplasma penetrans]|uniref:hypothetical protein n=2 Tax=Malacoplasma penetrans TaxID=28227 RepID=UPI0010132696|nr:hypothetical protein [Malacoplasma penetrans]RXY97404.1 hypothetical protein D8X55_00535 [Malacoplasma penetrans]
MKENKNIKNNKNKPFKGKYSEKEFIEMIKGCKFIDVDNFFISLSSYEDQKTGDIIETSVFEGNMKASKTKKYQKPKDPKDPIWEVLGKILDKLELIESDIRVLKKDVTVLKEDVAVLKEDVSKIKRCPTIARELAQLH